MALKRNNQSYLIKKDDIENGVMSQHSIVDPLAHYKTMKDNTFGCHYQWSATTTNNWPVNANGYNMAIIFRGTADLGMIIVISNGKTYTATVRTALTSLVYQVLN